MSDFPACITVAFEEQLDQCEYIRREMAEQRVDNLQDRIRELKKLVKVAYFEGYNDGYDDFDGYHDMSKASPDSCWKHSDVKTKLEGLMNEN